MPSRERILHHYRVERELADRSRLASKDERRVLYAAVYDELFRRLPDHEQIEMKADVAAQAPETALQFGMITRFLRPETRFLEIGPGDCALAMMVASRVACVYAVNVQKRSPSVPTPLRTLI